MLLSTRQSLADILVSILAEQSSSDVRRLHHEVASRHRHFSLPAVYKELRNLQEQGVVVRRKKELSLNMTWILNLIDLADRMYDTHVESPVPANVLPLETGKTTFRFSNLARVDDFWMHAAILMLQHSQRKTMFQWFPHPWFNLVHSQK